MSLTENWNVKETELTEKEMAMLLEQDVGSSIIRVRNAVEQCLSVTKDVGLIQNIVLEAMKEESNGQRRTENMSEARQRKDITVIPQNTSPPSSGLVTSESHTGSLVLPRENLDEGKSLSLSLLDSSAKELHEALKKLLTEETHNPERRYPLDAHRVSVAVKCASEIAKLIKVKVEAHKLWSNN